MNQSTRYVIRAEPAPIPRPRWWRRGMFQIIDLTNRTVIAGFNAYAAAEACVRCLDGDGRDCVARAGNSHVERWAGVS